MLCSAKMGASAPSDLQHGVADIIIHHQSKHTESHPRVEEAADDWLRDWIRDDVQHNGRVGVLQDGLNQRNHRAHLVAPDNNHAHVRGQAGRNGRQRCVGVIARPQPAQNRWNRE